MVSCSGAASVVRAIGIAVLLRWQCRWYVPRLSFVREVGLQPYASSWWVALGHSRCGCVPRGVVHVWVAYWLTLFAVGARVQVQSDHFPLLRILRMMLCSRDHSHARCVKDSKRRRTSSGERLVYGSIMATENYTLVMGYLMVLGIAARR